MIGVKVYRTTPNVPKKEVPAETVPSTPIVSFMIYPMRLPTLS